jgi:hypothetical protein
MFAGGFECPNWWRKGEEKIENEWKEKRWEKGKITTTVKVQGKG